MRAGRDYETKNFSFEDIHVDAPKRLARVRTVVFPSVVEAWQLADNMSKLKFTAVSDVVSQSTWRDWQVCACIVLGCIPISSFESPQDEGCWREAGSQGVS